ncbi:MAG: tRNA pseudouridine(55) synthase TruB, partial [Cyanobacteria bacterium P01_F01_bin.42]
EIEVAIACGPGTYIRAIARDLGQRLGVGATLAQLIRTKSCGLNLDKSLTFEDIEAQLEAQTFRTIPFSEALENLESLTLDTALTKRWYFGQRLPIQRKIASADQSQLETPDSIPIFVKTEADIALGLGLWKEGVLSPKVVLSKESGEG